MRPVNSSRRSSPRSAHIKVSVPSTGSPRPSDPMTSPTYSRGIALCVRLSCRFTTGCRATPSHSVPLAVGRIRRTVQFHLTRCGPYRRDSTIWEQWRMLMPPSTRWATNLPPSILTCSSMTTTASQFVFSIKSFLPIPVAESGNNTLPSHTDRRWTPSVSTDFTSTRTAIRACRTTPTDSPSIFAPPTSLFCCTFVPSVPLI